jgi:asparagine synthase (glutamine-hydrolysing)
MCGITGFLSTEINENKYPSLLSKMSKKIAHRGPNDSGHWFSIDDKIGLAHRRLSILDISKAGAQPMHSHSNRYVIVYNGEIYNHLSIRKEIFDYNKFNGWTGTSDTETLLKGFELWGIEKMLQKCTGMFAIAVWDKKNKCLNLARDRIGEKPLYYGWQGKSFIFGSELKAFYPHPDFKKDINKDSIFSLLRYYNVSGPNTIFKDIYKLRPGTILNINQNNTYEEKVFWSAHDMTLRKNSEIKNKTDKNIKEELLSLLKNTVKNQMLSDVPLGAFLSGGIDSSLIVSLMQEQSNYPIKTFTIGFDEKGYNEAKFAKIVAKELGTDHTEMYVSPTDALNVIPELPKIYDEPFSDTSQIPTYLVSQLASKNVKVSLSGDGGDELFCGYNRYLMADKIFNKMRLVPIPIRKSVHNALKNIKPSQWDKFAARVRFLLPDFAKLNNLGDKFYKGIDLISSDSMVDLYLRLVTHWDDPSKALLEGKDRLLVDYPKNIKFSSFDEVRGMMLMDLVTFLPDDLLVKMDRAAMAVSLETRAPFLDHKIVEYAFNLPQKFKVRNGNTKWILKKILKEYMPETYFDRPKMGFAVPIGDWLRGPLKEWADELLNETRLKNEGYFNQKEIKLKWEQHIKKTHNWDYHLWDVLMFQAWLENFKSKI